MLGFMGTELTALVYQFKGESWSADDMHRPDQKNWRNFKVAEIEDLELLKTKTGKVSTQWFTHENYTGASAGWVSVLVKITP